MKWVALKSREQQEAEPEKEDEDRMERWVLMEVGSKFCMNDWIERGKTEERSLYERKLLSDPFKIQRIFSSLLFFNLQTFFLSHPPLFFHLLYLPPVQFNRFDSQRALVLLDLLIIFLISFSFPPLSKAVRTGSSTLLSNQDTGQQFAECDSPLQSSPLSSITWGRVVVLVPQVSQASSVSSSPPLVSINIWEDNVDCYSC